MNEPTVQSQPLPVPGYGHSERVAPHRQTSKVCAFSCWLTLLFLASIAKIKGEDRKKFLFFKYETLSHLFSLFERR